MRAEHDAAAELLDADGIASLRSMHGICSRASLRQGPGERHIQNTA